MGMYDALHLTSGLRYTSDKRTNVGGNGYTGITMRQYHKCLNQISIHAFRVKVTARASHRMMANTPVAKSLACCVLVTTSTKQYVVRQCFNRL